MSAIIEVYFHTTLLLSFQAWIVFFLREECNEFCSLSWSKQIVQILGGYKKELKTEILIKKTTNSGIVENNKNNNNKSLFKQMLD